MSFLQLASTPPTGLQARPPTLPLSSLLPNRCARSFVSLRVYLPSVRAARSPSYHPLRHPHTQRLSPAYTNVHVSCVSLRVWGSPISIPSAVHTQHIYYISVSGTARTGSLAWATQRPAGMSLGKWGTFSRKWISAPGLSLLRCRLVGSIPARCWKAGASSAGVRKERAVHSLCRDLVFFSEHVELSMQLGIFGV